VLYHCHHHHASCDGLSDGRLGTNVQFLLDLENDFRVVPLKTSCPPKGERRHADGWTCGACGLSFARLSNSALRFRSSQEKMTMASGNHAPRSVTERFTLSQVVLYQLVTISFLYMKAPVLRTSERFSWRNMHSRVGVTFPALIFARLHLCRRLGNSDLTHGVIRFHYHFIYILNTMRRSKKIPGVGCRETPLDP
jgi:hypothetical protein